MCMKYILYIMRERVYTHVNTEDKNRYTTQQTHILVTYLREGGGADVLHGLLPDVALFSVQPIPGIKPDLRLHKVLCVCMSCHVRLRKKGIVSVKGV